MGKKSRRSKHVASGGSRSGKIVYTGQPNTAIPRDVKYVRIDPSVKVIAAEAFKGCKQLEVVELCEGLEIIGPGEFYGCISLKCIKVPSTVKVIGSNAFSGCEQLEEVELREGLGQIGASAFRGCKSVNRFSKVPSTVKEIGSHAFYCCDQLQEVEFCGGLERIGKEAFRECKSLKRAKIPSTVKMIGNSAFSGCDQLAEVELCEGLEQIGFNAFFRCTSLGRIEIPSTTKAIEGGSFRWCKQLVEVELCEGLEKIEESAFQGCSSLQCMKIPSTVKVISREAFQHCSQLVELELHEGLEGIEGQAFHNCVSLKHMRVPPTVKLVGEGAFDNCQQLIGVVLCDKVEKIAKGAFRKCFSLRNLVIPAGTQTTDGLEPGCYDLLKLCDSQSNVIRLKSRFDDLSIHKLCYYQSYQPTGVTVEQIDNIIDPMPPLCPLSVVTRDKQNGIDSDQNESLLKKQDCLGMTPLHILASSTDHDIDLYRFIVASCPANLIIEDNWSCPPLLYEIWGDAPPEIELFLIDKQKSTFPNHVLNWDKMVETLCRARASVDVVGRLLDAHEVFFSEQNLNWPKAARELAIRCLIRVDHEECWDWRRVFFEDWGTTMEVFSASQKNQELDNSLQEIHRKYFADQNNTRWQVICEELIAPLKGWWRPGATYESMRSFHFLIKCNIAERLNAFLVRQWQTNIKHCLNAMGVSKLDIIGLVEKMSSVDKSNLEAHFDDIHSKLVYYEREYRAEEMVLNPRERQYYELNSDDDQINEMMSAHSMPSGKFVEDWIVSQHYFKMPRGEGSIVRRNWLSRTSYQDHCLGRKFYCPQVGDSVVYIPRAHYDTIRKYPDCGYSQPWKSWPTSSSWPVVCCNVTHVRYRFPSKMYYRSHCRDEKLWGVSAILTLEISGVPSTSGHNFPWPTTCFIPIASRTHSHEIVEFDVTVFECSEDDFIIPQYLYSWRIGELERAIVANDGNVNGLSVTVFCPLDDQDDAVYPGYTGRLVSMNETREDELHFVGSGYNALLMRWDLKEDSEDEDIVACFCSWNVTVNNHSCAAPVVLPTMEENARRAVKAALHSVINLDPKVNEWFYDHVDTSIYTDYLEMIEVPMHLSLIQKRLASNYYTNKVSVLADMELVKENCYKYTEDGNEFYELACLMYDKFKSLVDFIEDTEGVCQMHRDISLYASVDNFLGTEQSQRPVFSTSRVWQNHVVEGSA